MEFRPFVAIPSYNTGSELILRTVNDVLKFSLHVHVIVDGSTDGSAEALLQLAASESRLRVTLKHENTGKGDSLRQLGREAAAEGWTHMLCVDADGQHPGAAIPEFLECARNNPEALIMGRPIFGADVPKARLYGRRLTIFWTDIETLFCGLGDTLFGMRVYPLEAFNRAFEQTRFARGFDFDPEIAVRLAWMGVQPLQVAVKVRYLTASEGGVSHFNYVRDNLKLTLLHFRLIPEFLLLRLLPFLQRKSRWNSVTCAF